MPDPLGSQNVVLRNENEVKAHLSEYLRAAESGETVVICRRNVPIADIRALSPKSSASPRPIGLAQDWGEPLPDSFFESLPTELLAAFGGQGK